MRSDPSPTARALRALEDVAPWDRPAMGRLEPMGQGRVLAGSTNNPAMHAEESLPTVPFRFRAEGGAELRTEVARLTAAVRGPGV